MNQPFEFLDIIVLGALAVIVVLMLRSVLGRRTGDEQERASNATHRRETAAAKRSPVNPVPPGAPANEASPSASIDEFAEPGSKLAQTLTEIQLADKSFDPGAFVSGAKAAYEMIVTAFAKGDKKTLKPLLNDEIFKSFSSVIDDHHKKGETVETTFVGISSSKISSAALTGKIAEITIRFVSELISSTKNSDGAVIDGDPNQVFKVTDVWTFSRDIRAGDPNWKLTATAAG